MRNPFKYFNSSPEVIRIAVLMYVRYPLSLRNVEDLLAERGIDICHEIVRHWWNRFGPMFAADGRGDTMKATQMLRDLGQSLWLDNITRNLLRTGVLRRYIDELSVTGLTSNPTIFDNAIRNGKEYDDAIKSKLADGKSGDVLRTGAGGPYAGRGPVPAGLRPN